VKSNPNNNIPIISCLFHYLSVLTIKVHLSLVYTQIYFLAKTKIMDLFFILK